MVVRSISRTFFYFVGILVPSCVPVKRGKRSVGGVERETMDGRAQRAFGCECPGLPLLAGRKEPKNRRPRRSRDRTKNTKAKSRRRRGRYLFLPVVLFILFTHATTLSNSLLVVFLQSIYLY